MGFIPVKKDNTMKIETPVKPEAEVKKYVPTAEMVAAFIAAIIAGNPIGKIFPDKISLGEFSQEHKDQIKAARNQRKAWCKENKQRVLKVLGRKSMVVDRITERPQRTSVSAVNTAYVKPAKAAK